jgi:hypothetical protein
VKSNSQAKQNNLPPECGQLIDAGVSLKKQGKRNFLIDGIGTRKKCTVDEKFQSVWLLENTFHNFQTGLPLLKKQLIPQISELEETTLLGKLCNPNNRKLRK